MSANNGDGSLEGELEEWRDWADEAAIVGGTLLVAWGVTQRDNN